MLDISAFDFLGMRTDRGAGPYWDECLSLIGEKSERESHFVGFFTRQMGAG
jgi:cellobiose phosphorylase